MATAHSPQTVPSILIGKIGALSRERMAEVEDFVDFIAQRAQRDSSEPNLARVIAAASIPALSKVWNNPEDDVYDAI
ncbi:MAG: hypothetical protein RLY97_293 [Pseudomonadota bacterium]|jgi:hypothetical protein